MSGKLAGEGKVEGEWVEGVGPGGGGVVGRGWVGGVAEGRRGGGEGWRK